MSEFPAKDAREAKGISLEEAARQLRVSIDYLRRLERRQRPVPFGLAEEMWDPRGPYGCGGRDILNKPAAGNRTHAKRGPGRRKSGRAA
jgi:hypothetical protein